MKLFLASLLGSVLGMVGWWCLAGQQQLHRWVFPDSVDTDLNDFRESLR